ncbi:protein phosphatase [Favolaschia claudopus]|uniref:Protein phosphatase n=1 Tax=Favolaschia claudopus TaxID=2862362 RepID=A0AAW0AP75_9AGAR
MIRRPYIFHSAAEWAAKPPWKDAPKPKFTFPANSPIRSWRDKSLARLSSQSQPRSAGEDFLLCTNMQRNSGLSIGVADGVGGWIDQGIDCSIFSTTLLFYCRKHFENGWAGEPEIDPSRLRTASNVSSEGVEMTPLNALQLAYQDLLADESVIAGSSTASLLTLNASSGLLRSANLGDSGFCIVRSSAMFYNSPPQTHFFNCPWQLSKFNDPGDKIVSINDSPRAAQEYSTRLIDGDIIIAYTDGLSDNVFPDDILKICALVMQGLEPDEAKVQNLARSLVHYAQKRMDGLGITPFELEARRHRKQVWRGGKVDDVTVVVALVKETP